MASGVTWMKMIVSNWLEGTGEEVAAKEW